MNAGDVAEYFRVSGLDGLEVMSARWLEHSFSPHMHDFHAVSLNYGGRAHFIVAVRFAMPRPAHAISSHLASCIRVTPHPATAGSIATFILTHH